MKGLLKPKHAALNHETEKELCLTVITTCVSSSQWNVHIKKSSKCDQLAMDNCQ